MFNDGINKIEVYGEKPCIAINQSIEETIIVEKISKLGNSIYSINKIDIDLEVAKNIIEACQGKLKVMGHAPELTNSKELIELLLIVQNHLLLLHVRILFYLLVI